MEHIFLNMMDGLLVLMDYLKGGNAKKVNF